MKNNQNITVCYFLSQHPVRDVSLGRRSDINHQNLHPVRDVSLGNMKRVFFIVVLSCIIAAGVSAQTSAKDAFQNSIVTFLRNDLGLSPSIDSDGDVEFKDSDDETHYVRILSSSAPFFVILSR